MIVRDWLLKSSEQLNSSSVPTAQLDAEILLADHLKKDRSWLHAHPDFELQRSDLHTLDEQIDRRATHEPLAYIRGKSEFYGREFVVSADTLQPRSETETMITMLKKINPDSIFDIGTGSGCIAITAKLELTNASVIGVDVSEKCLETATANATKLGAKVDFYKSDLLADIPVKKLAGATLCCNLPYVPDDFHINEAARHEPSLAIFGGSDGLDLYRDLFEQLASIPENLRPKDILTETLPSQHEDLSKIAEILEYNLIKTDDFIQHYSID
jgi:release factor glutamine methyltransferase